MHGKKQTHRLKISTYKLSVWFLFIFVHNYSFFVNNTSNQQVLLILSIIFTLLFTLNSCIVIMFDLKFKNYCIMCDHIPRKINLLIQIKYSKYYAH